MEIKKYICDCCGTSSNLYSVKRANDRKETTFVNVSKKMEDSELHLCLICRRDITDDYLHNFSKETRYFTATEIVKPQSQK